MVSSKKWLFNTSLNYTQTESKKLLYSKPMVIKSRLPMVCRNLSLG